MNFLPTDTVLFDDQKYKVEIRLINSSGIMPIPNGVVTQLIIEDNLYSIFYSGRMIINSSENQIETFVGGSRNELKESTDPSSYTFNIDNRDNIEISITPVTDQGEDPQTFPPHLYGMYYLFAIYDEEEVIDPKADTNKKSKIFYLRDARAQTLEETNIQWSTTRPLIKESQSNINVNHIGNRLRQIKTGDAIRSLIVDALPMFGNTFHADWDVGATDVFYTSSPQTNAFEDLEYLLDRHISAVTEDNCILRYERDGSWSLRSYNSLFESAVIKNENRFGPGIMDIFNVHSGTINAGKPGNQSKIAPYNPFGVSSEQSQQLLGLTKFNFLNVSNHTSMKEVISTFVHTYNSSQKQFNIDGKETHIDEVKKKFQNLYADPMVGKHPTAIFPTNTEQSENKICKHVKGRGKYRAERLKSGVNRIMNKALAYSPGVSFSVKGSTHRTAGKFVVVVGQNIPMDSGYGKTLQGEWLATSVIHTFSFEANKYFNNITCTKPHASTPILET